MRLRSLAPAVRFRTRDLHRPRQSAMSRRNVLMVAGRKQRLPLHRLGRIERDDACDLGATGLISFVNAGSATVTVITGGPTLVACQRPARCRWAQAYLSTQTARISTRLSRMLSGARLAHSPMRVRSTILTGLEHNLPSRTEEPEQLLRLTLSLACSRQPRRLAIWCIARRTPAVARHGRFWLVTLRERNICKRLRRALLHGQRLAAQAPSTAAQQAIWPTTPPARPP